MFTKSLGLTCMLFAVLVVCEDSKQLNHKQKLSEKLLIVPLREVRCEVYCNERNLYNSIPFTASTSDHSASTPIDSTGSTPLITTDNSSPASSSQSSADNSSPVTEARSSPTPDSTDSSPAPSTSAQGRNNKLSPKTRKVTITKELHERLVQEYKSKPLQKRNKSFKYRDFPSNCFVKCNKYIRPYPGPIFHSTFDYTSSTETSTPQGSTSSGTELSSSASSTSSAGSSSSASSAAASA